MLFDRYNRPIEYMRVAVTDRCNLRCRYCMPPGGVPFKSHASILRYEQIEAVAREAVKLGVVKLRITGGEPLVRRNIEELIAMLSVIQGLDELCMTTNGTLLSKLAGKLHAAGLNRVNISIDTLDSEKYNDITGGGNLNDAIAGVDAALEHGLGPVKINMVVYPETLDNEVDAMREFCDERGVFLQTISHFTLDRREHSNGMLFTDRPPKCEECNRIRLTSDGFLKPCLFSEDEIKMDFNDIRGSLISAVRDKPLNGTHCRTRLMHAIGG